MNRYIDNENNSNYCIYMKPARLVGVICGIVFTLLLAFFLIVGGIWYKLPDMIGREIEAPDTSEEEI